MVQGSQQLRAPYAPANNVLSVIHQMRERGLSEVVNLSTLDAIGIPEGNQPRALAALKFLGLVDDQDRRTPLFDRLGKAASEDYQSILEEILRSAYAPVFELRDPTEDSIERITDAFRLYEPSRQRERMVTLFMALCAEAGIVSVEQARAQRTTPRAQPRIRQQRPAGNRRDGGAKGNEDISERPDVRAIHAWVDQLPLSGVWSPQKRDRWLAALEGLVDYAIDVVERAPERGSVDIDEDDDDA